MMDLQNFGEDEHWFGSVVRWWVGNHMMLILG